MLAAAQLVLGNPALAHGASEHLFVGAESPSEKASTVTLRGTVTELTVDDRLLGASVRYVGLLRDDGTRVRIKGQGLGALTAGTPVEVKGRLDGTTLFMSDWRAAGVATPASVRAKSSTAVLSGRLTLFHTDDPDTGRSDFHYAVVPDAGGRPTEVRFAVVPDILDQGMQVRVSGEPTPDGLAVDVSSVTVLSLGTPAQQPDAGIAGVKTNQMLVMLVKFTNSPADPFTQAQVQTAVFGGAGSGSVSEFYKEASYGQQLLAGSVTPWMTVPMATPTTCDYNGIGNAADTAATAAGYNVSAYQNRFYIFAKVAACGWAGLGYIGFGEAYSNASMALLVIGHELGHNFGALHAASLDCGPVSVGGTCTSAEYGDEWDIMGNRRAMHFNGAQKSLFGWITTGVKTQTSGTQTYTLTPIETAGGSTYAIKVPGRSFRTYWMEYRQPLGFDTALSGFPNNGVQVRVAYPFESLCSGCADDTELLDMTPATASTTDGTLVAGQSFHDNVTGLHVSVVSATATAATVQVSVTPHPPAPDFDRNGTADLIWRDTSSGTTSLSLMSGVSSLSSTTLFADPNWTVLGTGDFDGDGMADIVWWNASTQQTGIWLMNGSSPKASAMLASNGWKVAAVGDFNGDGRSDLVFRSLSTGQTAIWLMNGLTTLSGAVVLADPNWVVTHVGDFNDDGRDDLVWRNTVSGQTAIWLMNGTTTKSTAVLPVAGAWQVVAVGDLNGDNKADLIWHNTSNGQTALWLMNGTASTSTTVLWSVPGWSVTNAADLNGDGKADLIWRNGTTGEVAVWLMNGLTQTSGAVVLSDANWSVAFVSDLNHDGKADLVWTNTSTGASAAWLMNGLSSTQSSIISTNPSMKVQPLMLP